MTRVARRQIAAAVFGETAEFSATGFKNETGADDVAPILADELDAEPMVRIVRLGFIAQQYDRVVDAADDEVRPAVVVEIAHGQSSAEVVLLEKTAAAGCELC